jgi:hypothetical protein
MMQLNLITEIDYAERLCNSRTRSVISDSTPADVCSTLRSTQAAGLVGARIMIYNHDFDAYSILRTIHNNIKLD